MAKPQGPKKHMFSVRLTEPTVDRIKRDANGLPVGTYIAAQEEARTELENEDVAQ